MSNRKGKKKKTPTIPVRPVDRRLDAFQVTYKDFALKEVSVVLCTLGILGLIWTIPFPAFEFLGKFNGFFNWASILIAFVIYFYYRLAPVLSYLVIFIIGIYSYCIVQLEYWAAGGGPAFWLSTLLVFLLGGILYFSWSLKTKQGTRFADFLNFMLIGPLYLASRMIRLLKLPY